MSFTQLPEELPELWEWGKEGIRVLPKARLNSSGPTGPTSPNVSEFSQLMTWSDWMCINHSIPTFLCGEKWWRLLTTRVQENKGERGTEYISGLSTMILHGPFKPQPREDGNEEGKENQGEESQGQKSPQLWYCHNFSYQHRCPENPKPQDHKMTKKTNHQLNVPLLSRLSRVEMSKCHLTISTIIWFSHPTRRNEYEIPAIRNEQKIGAEDLKCLLFACWPDNYNYIHYLCSMFFFIFT